MRLIDFYTTVDYGRDAYLTLGQFENFNILDAEFHSSCYWDWEPNLELTLSVFSGSVFSLGIRFLSFSFSVCLIPYRCPMNLSHTREQ
jgi:hypothetical protein